MDYLDKASRKLTQILRHQIIEYKLEIDSDGYVKFIDIINLNLPELKNITIDDIYVIVDTNNKKRLELKTINNILYIRAAQGHSKAVGLLINDNKLLEEITLDYPNEYIYHGTQLNFINSILKNGLNRMGRKHIHFVDNIDRDKQISGFRSRSNTIITVDIKKCIKDGIKFYKSSNNVILTEGDNGIIHPKYFIK